MKILSLGWGVQSFTLAAMVALGELEPIDYAIHADTTHESALTYEFADRWREWLEDRGVLVVVVATHEKKNIIDKWGGMQLPAFTASAKGDGQIRRQCTYEWKIRPMREWISTELDRRGEKKTVGIVQQLLGISFDEYQRMKQSDVQYIQNQYPLIDKRMTRSDCKQWLLSHGLPIPPRSACVFCPYKKQSEWRLTKTIPADWEEAISVDNMIRDTRPPEQLFVHPSRKPLENIDFRTMEEKGQLSLWDNECSGICGV
jgi:hypothetical protein